MKTALKVAVTGAAGQLAYAFLFRLAAGEVFGKDQPIQLRLLEVSEGMPRLEGVCMELEDGAFPLLKGIHISSDPLVAFEDVSWAILIGSVPRKQGMERKDLLQINGSVFVQQGKALEQKAASDIRTLVIGNPCNTNCLIAMHQAPSIPKDRWFAMTRLDEDRAKIQLAKKAQVPVGDVKRLGVWGNHSLTQYLDFENATIEDKKVPAVISDKEWLESIFLSTVQTRGGAVLKARGVSSAASAANSAVNSIRSVIEPTSANDWHSIGIWSEKNPYGFAQDLIFSFPLSNDGKDLSIVSDLTLSAFAREKIKLSEQELLEERAMVQSLL